MARFCCGVSVLWACLAVSVTGCTSVSSVPAKSLKHPNGVVYVLPNRLIDVQVQFSTTGKHSISVKGGSYYPDADPASIFVARAHEGKIGSIKASLTTSNGLLQTAESTYTGKADEFATAVGDALGAVNGRAVSPSEPGSVDACKAQDLTVSLSIPLVDRGKKLFALGDKARCSEVTLTVDPLFDDTLPSMLAVKKKPRKDGLWYRIELPYQVTAALGQKTYTTSVVMLPDDSPAFFVEMESGIFADANNKVGFSNGILTSYEGGNDSEVISLLKLPAGIIAAYATAVGAVFSNFSAADKHEINSEITKINQQLMLEKIEACKVAMEREQPEETIASLCGLTPLPE